MTRIESAGRNLGRFTLAATLAMALIATSEPIAQGLTSLSADLDRIFSAPALSRGLLAARFEAVDTGAVVYERRSTERVIPASVLKTVTSAVAAERLGWDHRFETRLEAVGSAARGVFRGDLVVTSDGDPTIVAEGPPAAPLFDEWADALKAAGIRRVEGRLIGDDSAFDDEPLGAGWAWDYLFAGYAAPSGALNYNENIVILRIEPGQSAGTPASVSVAPAGHGLTLDASIDTGGAGAPTSIEISRTPGSTTLRVRGRVAVDTPPTIRTAAVDNPTKFFIEALRHTLATRGIVVTGGAWDVDEIAGDMASAPRRTIATRLSPPLSALVGYALKVSQNAYAETLMKTLGRTRTAAGSTERGRAAVRNTLAAWGLSTDALVMYDGSGLSRYNYASAELLTGMLTHVWNDARLRGPFVAALPVGGRDGTLGSRMRHASLHRRVQAKTGTINNMRSLVGYLHTENGRVLAFSMIANHFTAPISEIDAVMEEALMRVARGG